MNECLGHVRQQVIAIRGQNAHTAVDQGQDAQLLGDQLASETASILDDHSSHAVTLRQPVIVEHAKDVGGRSQPEIPGRGVSVEIDIRPCDRSYAASRFCVPVSGSNSLCDFNHLGWGWCPGKDSNLHGREATGT